MADLGPRFAAGVKNSLKIAPTAMRRAGWHGQPTGSSLLMVLALCIMSRLVSNIFQISNIFALDSVEIKNTRQHATFPQKKKSRKPAWDLVCKHCLIYR